MNKKRFQLGAMAIASLASISAYSLSILAQEKSTKVSTPSGDSLMDAYADAIGVKKEAKKSARVEPKGRSK